MIPGRTGTDSGPAPPRTRATSGLDAFGLGRRVRERTSRYQVPHGTARRALAFARPQRRALAGFVVVVVLGAGTNALNPLLLRALIDQGIERHRGGLVVALALVMVGVALATSGLGLAQGYVAARVSESVVFDLRARLYRHVLDLPFTFFSRSRTGALVNRLNTDAAGAQRAFTDLLSNVVGNAVTVVIALSVMATLSWPITVAALALIPVFGLLGRGVGRRLGALTKQRLDQSAAVASHMTERFSAGGALLVKLFGRRREESTTFEHHAGELRDANVRIAVLSRSYSTVLLLGASLAALVIYGGGGDLAAHGHLQIGTLMALAAYLGGLYGPIGALAGASSDVMTMLVTFARVFELLDFAPPGSEDDRGIVLQPGPTRVTYDHVAFSYPQAAEMSLPSLELAEPPERTRRARVLVDVSFTADPGMLVALVGRTGAGKTTLGMLLPRCYDVTSGAIRLNNLDVRDAAVDSLRAKIGVVTQDVHLFHDTLRANLRYARPGASDADLREAIAAAYLSQVVDELPDGLDTIVGERGHRLSGGERQRVALARVFLKQPDVVVLDEATAHLDARSEAMVQHALDTALAGRTALVIAHRLSTIRRADLILVLERGAIVERGTHESLLARSGRYADLYRTQFAAQDGEVRPDEHAPAPLPVEALAEGTGR